MSEPDGLFCKIVAGEIDAEVVHEEDGVLAFNDMKGRAPMHAMGGQKLGMP